MAEIAPSMVDSPVPPMLVIVMVPSFAMAAFPPNTPTALVPMLFMTF